MCIFQPVEVEFIYYYFAGFPVAFCNAFIGGIDKPYNFDVRKINFIKIEGCHSVRNNLVLNLRALRLQSFCCIASVLTDQQRGP